VRASRSHISDLISHISVVHSFQLSYVSVVLLVSFLLISASNPNPNPTLTVYCWLVKSYSALSTRCTRNIYALFVLSVRVQLHPTVRRSIVLQYVCMCHKLSVHLRVQQLLLLLLLRGRRFRQDCPPVWAVVPQSLSSMSESKA
jgi:hypothetical protein